MIVTLAWNVLWQDAIVVALTAAMLGLMPRSSAATRYAVTFAALLALVAVPVVTTAVQLNALLFPSAPTASPKHGIFSLVALGPLASGTRDWLAWPTLLSNDWAARALLVFWCGGAAFTLTRLVVSFARVGRIRNDATLVDRADGVPILISSELAIPIATGLFSPAIILPEQLAASVSPNDRRCTIEHELAHVRRYDVLGNAVQRFLEAVFFWNPWMHIIGRRLIVEREAACDDWAIRRLGQPTAYAASLAELARRIVTDRLPLLTPSALGGRDALVGRIKRLVSGYEPRRSKLNYFAVGGIAVIFAILTILLQTLVPAQAQTGALDTTSNNTLQMAQACKNPSAPPEALNPAAPDLPKAEWPAKEVSAVVAVKVGADGKPHGATIYKSSGNANVDRAVLAAAQKSTYKPRLVNCEPASGTYLFKADFGPHP